MVRHQIPNFRRLLKRRHRELLQYLEEDGYAGTDAYASLAEHPPADNDELVIEQLAMDLNGTLTEGGALIDGVPQALRLCQDAGLKLFILTGDVSGTASDIRSELANAGIQVDLVVCNHPQGTAMGKLLRLIDMGVDRTVFVGNGQGDSLAVRAAFSIVVTQGELAACSSISGAVGHATSIVTALNALLNGSVIRATFHT